MRVVSRRKKEGRLMLYADDDPDLATWRVRTARTCPACGVKTVVDDVCATCGCRKSAYVARQPWMVAVTPTVDAIVVPTPAPPPAVVTPLPVAAPAEAWIAPRAMVVLDAPATTPIAPPVATLPVVPRQGGPAVAKIPARRRGGAPPAAQGNLF